MTFLIFSDLPQIEANARPVLARLREQMPGLDADLVYSNRFGQARFQLGVVESLTEFPRQFDVPASEIRRLSLELLDAEALMTISAEDRAELDPVFLAERVAEGTELRKKAFAELESIPLAEDLVVELRFAHLDFDLVGRLKRHELVWREGTDPSPASIRVALGTLRSFLRPPKP